MSLLMARAGGGGGERGEVWPSMHLALGSNSSGHGSQESEVRAIRQKYSIDSKGI